MSVETFPFELNREAQVVLYLVDGTETSVAAIEDLASTQSQYRHAILHQVLLFDASEPEGDALWISSKPNAIKTLMCDLTVRLLKAMQDYVLELNDLPSIEAPLESSRKYASQDIAARVHARMSVRPSSRSSRSSRPSSARSPIRHSVASPTPDKSRRSARARIVLGALTLQAGLWPDALRDLSEGTTTARSNGDHVWHAKGLECIVACLFMLGWAEMPFKIPEVCYSKPAETGDSLSLHYLTKLLPDLLATVHDLYAKALAFTQDAFPQFLMSESILRRGSVLSTLPTVTLPLIRSLVAGQSLPPTSVRKTEISALLIDAIPEIPQVLPLSDLVQILIGLASVLASIGMTRKQAFVLGDLLQRITPGLIEARKVGAAEVGIHPATGLLSLSSRAGFLRLEEGMRGLLTHVGSLYGTASAGSFELQIEILKWCIAICEALPDFQGVINYAVQTLHLAKSSKLAPPKLPQDEQTKLLTQIKRAVSAADKLDIPVQAEYWDAFLVRSVEAREAPAAVRLAKQPSVLPKNPFIYNPYLKIAADKQPLVAGELAYFTVCLQNPFEFEVEIERISLVAENFEASQHSIVLGGLCCQNFTLAGTPQAGTLTVTGCQAKIKYCKEDIFFLYSGSSKTTASWTVLEAQPTLSLQSTALSQPSLMILEGETRTFEITLQNDSDTPADLIRFSFQDSATTQLQDALGKDLSAVDRYELEYQINHSPLRLHSGPDAIAPKRKEIFTVEVVGTPGLLEATVHVDYGRAGEVYMRQLSFRIGVTVNAGVEVLRSNIVLAPAQCLLLLDLRNVWPSLLEVTVQPDGKTESLLPGHVSRMVLPVPRLYIANPHAPVPLLDKRQFVVSATQTSAEAERTAREAFWYREELLKHVSATWKEDGRAGTVVLRRGIRLSPRMVDCLRIDDVEISCSGPATLANNTFATVVVQIHNRSAQALHLSLRIQPSLRNQPHNIALDLSKRFAWTGMLQRVLHPALAPGEILETKLGVMALCAGEYEIGATVEELRESERRIWHSREPCRLDVIG